MGPRTALRQVVLDTNVLVSALLFSGPAQRLAELWQTGEIRLLASAAMIRELARVLAYPKFRLGEDEIEGLLHEEVLPYVTPVTVSAVARVVPEDPADDEFLACALTGRADAIVGGDKHLLRLKRYRGVLILTIRQFLEGT